MTGWFEAMASRCQVDPSSMCEEGAIEMGGGNHGMEIGWKLFISNEIRDITHEFILAKLTTNKTK